MVGIYDNEMKLEFVSKSSSAFEVSLSVVFFLYTSYPKNPNKIKTAITTIPNIIVNIFPYFPYIYLLPYQFPFHKLS